MSNKLIAGLFVLIFTITSVQTLAILKLSGGKDASSVSGVVIRDTMTAQVADTVKPDTGRGLPGSLRIAFIHYHPDGSCVVEIYNNDNLSHPIAFYQGNTITDQNGNNIGCRITGWVADQGDKDVGVQFLSIQKSENGGISVSGNSPILVSQFKLLLSGYLEKDEVTGLIDIRTRSATALLQRAKGLTPTGTYNSETNAVIDQALASAEVEDITGHRFIINQ